MSKLLNTTTLAISISFCALTIAGCATQPQPVEQAAASSAQAAEVEQVAEDEQSSTTDVANAGDEIICTREAVIGSRFKDKVCATRAQRDEARRKSQEFLREGGRSNEGGTPGG